MWCSREVSVLSEDISRCFDVLANSRSSKRDVSPARFTDDEDETIPSSAIKPLCYSLSLVLFVCSIWLNPERGLGDDKKYRDVQGCWWSGLGVSVPLAVTMKYFKSYRKKIYTKVRLFIFSHTNTVFFRLVCRPYFQNRDC